MKTKPIILFLVAISLFLAFVCLYNRKNSNYSELVTGLFNRISTNKIPGDTSRVNLLNKKAFDLRLTDPGKTILIADSALHIAEKMNYPAGIGEAFRVKGVGYSYLNNTEFAIKNYIEALNYFRKIGAPKRQARVYNNIGNLYKQNDYKKSLGYFKNALKLIEHLVDEELKAGIFFNIASIYQSNLQYTKAIYYYNRSNRIFLLRNDSSNIAMNLLNTGIIHFNLGQYSISNFKLLKAIDISKRKKFYSILPACYNTLASINIDKNEFNLAKKHITNGFLFAKKLQDKNAEKDLLLTAYELEYKRKNYFEALKHLKQLYKYDSLALSKQQSDNIGKTSTYYVQLHKLQEKELIIAKQRYKETIYWWILTIIIALVLLAIITGFIIIHHLKKKREKEELEINSRINILEQKALQAFMNPHFIYNILTTIQYFIGKQDNHSANNTLSKFAKLMRKHLEICMNNTISLLEEIQYLDLYLSLEKIRFSKKMEYFINITPETEEEEIFIPSMLIQPFIENAIWHGLMPKENGGFIKVDFNYIDNLLTISIIDNGIGILNSLNSKNSGHISRGLELIHERVNLLNKLNEKQITISHTQMGDSGTKVLITIEL
ncbi:histidine kinase [Daejeonella sp. H1SJ63]|uniref:tetratricopeptide repeat-containing sensor histidine kinase n=1 Tax=Daejeonella sp. H1SJ63 TaxID=3034145 RepID=UPI0023EC6EEF|nr:histidine kinase [Daejeonella sp. H1SJ63]